MLESPVDWLLVAIFVIGYLFITFEQKIGINKATSALLMGVVAWVVEFTREKVAHGEKIRFFGEHLSSIAEVVIFIVGALTIVEVINSHDGFRFIKNLLVTHSKRKMLWMIGAVAFIFSAFLGSLTMTLVLVALVSKIADKVEDRWVLGSGIVLAANAGGAFSPIGDITSTMLWIGGQLSTSKMVLDLFLPSLVCGIVALCFLQFRLKGRFEQMTGELEKPTPLSIGMFVLGLGAILFVPVIKGLTGLPPFMGILLGLSVVWLATDLLHRSEDRQHLTVPHIIGKLDFGGAVFFLGILLAVNALETAGILEKLAHGLLAFSPNPTSIALGAGIVSAIIDNVPLTAGLMGMFSTDIFPTDHFFWQLIAYSAGVGGSMLLIGSASGVALAGMENVPFTWYLKRVSLPALVAFIAGFLIYKFFICPC